MSKSSGSCTIYPYHGQNRTRDPLRLATQYDVVVTTYQTLQSDHGGQRNDTCQQIDWVRSRGLRCRPLCACSRTCFVREA